MNSTITTKESKMFSSQAKLTLIVRAILSVLFIGGYGVVLWSVLQPGVEFSTTATTILNFLLGALTTSIVGIMGFWFSSSQGSVDKTNAFFSKKEEE